MTEGSIQSQLQYLREEEKLARDVYLTLYQRWELRIFDNIAGAEQRHMDRIGAVLAARQIPDPVTDDSVGVFQDASLGALYQELVQRGSNSALDALRVSPSAFWVTALSVPVLLVVYATVQYWRAAHPRCRSHWDGPPPGHPAPITRPMCIC